MHGRAHSTGCQPPSAGASPKRWADLELDLTAEDLAATERVVPPGAAAGDRYHAPQMAVLDSEQKEASAT